MAHYKLVAEVREGTGKGVARKTRREGYVPGIAYGAGERNVPIKVKKLDLLELLREAHGRALVINLKIGEDDKLAFLQEVQRHPVTGEPIHVDFLILHEGEEVEVDVPVVVRGTPVGVRRGGVMEVITHALTVRSLPKNLPPQIEVDVSGLDLGDVIHAGDLKPEGFRIVDAPDTPIVTILAPRGLEVAEEAEGEAGEAAPSEGGEKEGE